MTNRLVILVAIIAVVAAVVFVLNNRADDAPTPALVSIIQDLEPVVEEPDSVTSFVIIPEAPLVLESGNGIVVIDLDADSIEGAAELVYRPVTIEELEQQAPEIPAVYTEFSNH